MKTWRFFTLFTTGTLLLTSACTQDKSTPEPIEGKPIHLSARVANQTTDFAFDLLQNIDATESKEENIFVSPLSLHIALGMLLNGSEGETREGIIKAIRAEGLTPDDLNAAYQTLMRELPEADKKVQLALANSMWYREGFEVKNSFKQVLADIFSSQIYDEPFDGGTVKKINQWASDHTAGKIDQVIDQIDGGMVMFLMNALYFKGDWTHEFDKDKTQDWNFSLSSGGEKQVKMMFLEKELRNYSDDDFDVVELPYSAGQFNLTLFVPKAGKDIHSLLQEFDSHKWQTVQDGLHKGKTYVGLPKFTLKYEIFLNEILSAMGMERVFTDQAELGGIADARILVSFVKQNTFLGIDESGTEAAAVTSIGIELTSVGPSRKTVIADKPFFFTISENTSNTILFTGRIMSP
ncbi:MAG: serpin family protein [Spirosomataceae bacterium]